MHIVITGGAGFIGSNLTESLCRSNEITVIDNLHSGNKANLTKSFLNDVKFHHCSCMNIGSLDLDEVDLIFHLGMPSSSPMYKASPYLVGDAISSTLGVFEYARDHDVGRVVYASSSSLYNGLPSPQNEQMPVEVTDYYTEARLCVERIARLYTVLHGVKSVGLRFFSVYGPHEEYKGKYANIVTQFLWDMQKGIQPVIYGDGNQRRDFIYVNDIVKAFKTFSFSNTTCDIFNVGTGVSYSFNNVVDILNEKLKTDIVPKYIEMPMKNYVSITQSDTTKADSKEYTPDYTLESGIDELIKYYNKIKV